MASHDTDAPTAVIAAVQLSGVDDHDHASNLAELTRLLKTLGYDVVGVVSQKRSHVRPGAILGQGKLFELAAYTGGTGLIPSGAENANDPEELETVHTIPAHPDGEYPHADVVIVDHEISPRQARNLEQATGADVIDRTGVIVEIFHRHAQTREARLQVEIARMTYVVPRLRAGARGADRQRGGVGGKGAGESALELDRRKVRDRVAELRAELAAIERDDELRRARRQGQRRVGLVGYTNAGKSSLMRALTGSEVLVEDKLFATLGTTVRALQPEVRPRILISDTVGFIRNLPHHLVASFRSTLDEALEASLLLHIVDCADPGFRGQLTVTREVLASIGADAVPSRLVLNKIDCLDDFRRRSLEREFPDAVQVSSRDPADVERLHALIVAFFEADLPEVELLVPYTRGAVIGQIRSTMRVISERHDEVGTHLTVRADAAALDRIRAQLA
ncbi:MAG: GTPase HflX [Myxococcales bacterium]|nr:GTPase HflX [Myxococcales bacterium]